MVEPKGVAYGKHLLTDEERGGRAEGDGLQIFQYLWRRLQLRRDATEKVSLQ